MSLFEPESVLTQFDIDESSGVEEVSRVIVALVKLRNAVDYRIAEATRIAEEIGVPRRNGAKSMTKLLIQEGLAPYIAYRAQRVGRRLPDIPTVAAHARDGALSGEHVDAIVTGLNHIQSRASLSDDEFDSCVVALSSRAFTSTPRDVSDKARALALNFAPDTAKPPVAEDRSLNELSLWKGDDGRFAGQIDLDCATGARLLTAMDPLCRPVAADDGSPDPRSLKKRQADALEQIVVEYLKRSSRPKQGGSVPNLMITMPLGALDPETSTRANDRGATMSWAGPISPSLAQALACDSTMSRVLLDSESVPLDIGVESRLVPAGIRKAVVVRDGGCIRCGRPPSWCDVHHIVPWSDGGETSLTNSALLCREDHTWLHQSGWTVVIGDDGHPWLQSPPSDESPQLVPSYSRRQSRPTSRLAS